MPLYTRDTLTDRLRTVYLRPYRKGMGPTFRLTMWATDKRDYRGQTRIGYRFEQLEGRRRSTLFTGEDFCGSPLHADDSDATVSALLGFLTLRPGDTDREYFDTYTEKQLAFCAAHAETLAAEAMARFGEG